jgi:hypothetical protein
MSQRLRKSINFPFIILNLSLIHHALMNVFDKVRAETRDSMIETEDKLVG